MTIGETLTVKEKAMLANIDKDSIFTNFTKNTVHTNTLLMFLMDKEKS